jgi:hypothetical protein
MPQSADKLAIHSVPCPPSLLQYYSICNNARLEYLQVFIFERTTRHIKFAKERYFENSNLTPTRMDATAVTACPIAPTRSTTRPSPRSLSGIDTHWTKIQRGVANILPGGRGFTEILPGGPLFWLLLHFY